jgi:hypothetical protein
MMKISTVCHSVQIINLNSFQKQTLFAGQYETVLRCTLRRISPGSRTRFLSRARLFEDSYIDPG